MLIVESEVCCERKPFEAHKEDCYFKRLKRKRQRWIEKLIAKFREELKNE